MATLLLVVVQANPVAAAGTPLGLQAHDECPAQDFQRYCDDDGAPHPNCSWMFRHVYGRSGGQKAPKNGWVSKVRVIACSAGSFYLQFGKVRKDPNEPGEYQAKVRKTSAKVSFSGDPDGCANSTHTINTPDVS